jgi:hypothetical protein
VKLSSEQPDLALRVMFNYRSRFLSCLEPEEYSISLKLKRGIPSQLASTIPIEDDNS